MNKVFFGIVSIVIFDMPNRVYIYFILTEYWKIVKSYTSFFLYNLETL